ncbi:hypothetical protein SAMN02745247_02345 [Butyrivibrio hungatei DSM 14810]|uniref:Uncharacterized protein n=1 Tax=Butyrivibrio hungatei DSM 14810 TaxID=1121132 RepID=A0A1M7SRZ5_9FIRM|nr:hypothetical protein [Butyrivibrio hungatei]SHN61317.1 hypothetical protein SAMN02745247_02345 [Butyrivibrio hungatei DSM 14810]
MKNLEASDNARLARISYRYDALPNKLKPIVYNVISDLLPNKNRGEVGLHLTKLMEKRELLKEQIGIYDNYDESDGAKVIDDMISEVAEDIYIIRNYLYFEDDEDDLTYDEKCQKHNKRKQIINSIKKMFEQKTINTSGKIAKDGSRIENAYLMDLADYFSVSPEVITEGYGKEYKLNWNILKKYVGSEKNIYEQVKKNIHDEISGYYEPNSSEDEIDNIIERLCKIIFLSDLLLADQLSKITKINAEKLIIEKDRYMIFEPGYLLYFADVLSCEQLVLVENLIKNIYIWGLDQEKDIDGKAW